MAKKVYTWRLYSYTRKTPRTTQMTEKEAQNLNKQLPKGVVWKKEKQ